MGTTGLTVSDTSLTLIGEGPTSTILLWNYPAGSTATGIAFSQTGTNHGGSLRIEGLTLLNSTGAFNPPTGCGGTAINATFGIAFPSVFSMNHVEIGFGAGVDTCWTQDVVATNASQAYFDDVITAGLLGVSTSAFQFKTSLQKGSYDYRFTHVNVNQTQTCFEFDVNSYPGFQGIGFDGDNCTNVLGDMVDVVATQPNMARMPNWVLTGNQYQGDGWMLNGAYLSNVIAKGNLALIGGVTGNVSHPPLAAPGVANGGSSYGPGPVSVTVNPADINCPQSGMPPPTAPTFSATVGGNGSITSLAVASQGTCYPTSPITAAVPLALIGGGAGFGATAYFWGNPIIVSSGSGFPVSPILSITPPAGTCTSGAAPTWGGVVSSGSIAGLNGTAPETCSPAIPAGTYPLTIVGGTLDTAPPLANGAYIYYKPSAYRAPAGGGFNLTHDAGAQLVANTVSVIGTDVAVVYGASSDGTNGQAYGNQIGNLYSTASVPVEAVGFNLRSDSCSGGICSNASNCYIDPGNFFGGGVQIPIGNNGMNPVPTGANTTLSCGNNCKSSGMSNTMLGYNACDYGRVGQFVWAAGSNAIPCDILNLGQKLSAVITANPSSPVTRNLTANGLLANYFNAFNLQQYSYDGFSLRAICADLTNPGNVFEADFADLLFYRTNGATALLPANPTPSATHTAGTGSGVSIQIAPGPTSTYGLLVSLTVPASSQPDQWNCAAALWPALEVSAPPPPPQQ